MMAWLVDVSSPEIFETLKLTFGEDFLASVPSDALNSFISAIRKHRYRKGESVFHEDDVRGDLYFVAAGHVKHTTISSLGREFTHHLSPPGDLFGTLTGDRRSGGTAALTDCDLLVVDRNTFLQFLSQSKQFSASMLERDWFRTAESVRKLHDLAFLTVPMRVAKVLLTVAERETDTSDLFVPEYLNQTELSHLVGTTRESINQCLRTFADQRWILMERRRIKILNPTALCNSIE